MAVSGAGRRKRRMIGGTIAAVAAIGVVSAVVVSQRAEAADPALTATAHRTDVIRSVSGTGSLVDELTYGLDVDGTATLTERAGTAVSAGGAGGGAQATSADSTGTAAAPATGTETVVSVAVQPGQRVARGQRIARVEDAAGTRRDVDSPVAGRVRTVTAAADATAGQLVTIGAGRVLAELAVGENRIAQIGTGQSVAVTLAAGSAATTGVVDAIEQVPDASSGALRYTVLVRLDRIPDGARIGMTATGSVTTAHADGVVAVPAAAVQVAGTALRVQVDDGDAQPRTVRVRIGLVGDTAVEVVSGLTAGQRVVVGAPGEVAATTTRLGPPAAVAGAGAASSASAPSTSATAAAR